MGCATGLNRQRHPSPDRQMVGRFARERRAMHTRLVDHNGLRDDDAVEREERHRGVKARPSFHASMPLFTLDRIIVTQAIVIDETGVHSTPLSREASDHLPIWARVTLPV